MGRSGIINLLSAVAVLASAGLARGVAGPFDGRAFHGRIAYSADGNYNDKDDWAASPVALAILAQAGVQDRSYHAAVSRDEAVLQKQANLLMLRYAECGAVVNAADPSDLARPSLPADGGSLIVSREGGHNRPAPPGIEYYLPYQTSIVRSGGRQAAMVVAGIRTSGANDKNFNRGWRHRNRRVRGRPGWYDWIVQGAALMGNALREEPDDAGRRN